MPTFTIDGQEIEIEPGKNVLQIAADHGVTIPHYCYHPGLTAPANCRMCLVEIEGARKLEPSCRTSVRDGMVVKTESPQVLDARAASNWLAGHVAGAVSVPFYRVEEAIEHLPLDTWIVAYCGCPHALSGRVVDTLRAAGFGLTAVLDEGWYPWESEGRPVTRGPRR